MRNFSVHRDHRSGRTLAVNQTFHEPRLGRGEIRPGQHGAGDRRGNNDALADEESPSIEGV